MSLSVTVVDYGTGNVLSVMRAIQKVGGSAHLSSDAAEIRRAGRLIVPGVGAFGPGMESLRTRGLDEALRAFAATGRPVLGICLGMQLFATSSEEFGAHAGLNLLPGTVVAIPSKAVDGTDLKVPLVGWAELRQNSPGGWSGTVLGRLGEASSVYLVHSYQFVPSDPDDRLADYGYGGRRIVAAVRRGNVTGCQFHPEKSGVNGLSVLSEFVRQ